MKVLDDFLKKNKPAKRKSKLCKFKDAILKLYKKDYTVQQIQIFLKEQKIETTTANIYYFIKEQGGKKNFSLQKRENQTAEENKELEEAEKEITLKDLRRTVNNKAIL